VTIPRPEYPRPHFDRSHAWLNLNGEWEFAPDPGDAGLSERWYANAESAWPATITVPFPWEHPASGVERHWLPIGWYRRWLQRPSGWSDQRAILHFGAVHHRADVWVNGRHLMRHDGGCLPFEVDVTDRLDDDGGATLVVRVEAPLDKRHIPHGKQRSMPADDYDGCAFTPSSGIWQTVWLEPRPATYISALRLRPTGDLTGIEAEVELAGPDAHGCPVTVKVDGARRTVTGPVAKAVLPIDNPRLWGPADPYLYTVTATAGGDEVRGYTGLRRVEWQDRLLRLNGSPIFLRGVLDQGFWPHGGHTAPDDGALRRDLELAREAGFNLVRKHLKLEDPRWLYWADRLGMLVWAEPPSTGRFTPGVVQGFEDVLAGMVQRDANHPSIVIWGAYNEEWGLDWDVPGDPAKQEAVRRAYHIVRDLDPTRPVMDNSGWAHVETDLVDWHYYDDSVASWARVVAGLANGDTDGFPVRLGPDFTVTKRIAAPGFDSTGRIWLNGEYGGGATGVERGWHQRWQTQELRRHDRVAGYIYTELYDIEHETVGVYTYDRRPKDLGGVVPAHTHADTTFVLDLVPVAPGRDLAPSTATIPVRVSHHGGDPVEGRIRVAWTGRFGEAPPDDSPLWTEVDTPAIVAKPFLLTEPVPVPVEKEIGRLHLAFATSGGVLARTAVDIGS
jgi:beta-galactosidase/beta-glucuronidase